MAKNESYEDFIAKFNQELPKTTDDCYTPTSVFEAVKNWVRGRIGDFDYIRPFYPGGDYEHAEYPPGVLVLDNPPFSIMSKIVDFYRENHIRFFLFANALTSLNTLKNRDDVKLIVCNSNIIYTNGAKVRTGFVTNLPGFKRITVSGTLSDAIAEAQDIKRKRPASVLGNTIQNAATLLKYAKYHQDIEFDVLDITREYNGKKIFGCGCRISEGDFERLEALRDGKLL